MHIEPSVVDGAKILLSYGTAGLSLGFLVKKSFDAIKDHGISSLLFKSFLTTLLVFSFFEVMPHFPVGISEVHFIFGSTLFLLFGIAPAAFGLATGLLIQGLLFAPFDLPQYGMNVTSLLAPLFAMAFVAEKFISQNTAYKDLRYTDVLKLSAIYQGGIIAWVALWAFYGNGFGAENLHAVYTFGLAYMSVVLIEPLVDLALLYLAKQKPEFVSNSFFEQRLHRGADAIA